MSALDLARLVEAVARAGHRDCGCFGDITPEWAIEEALPVVTAAVPLIEAAVREQIAASVLEWGQQYIIATRSEPGGLHWTCDHDFPGASCDTCFTNAGHATQVAARIARGAR